VDGDSIETAALGRVFSRSSRRPGIYSSKGALGHLLAGAPVADAVIAVSMIRTGIIPGTITSLPLENNISPLVVHGEPKKTNPTRVLVNCQSVEGQAASIVVGAV